MARIIDGDGHIVEPPALWSRSTPLHSYDRVPQIVQHDDGMPCMWLEGEVRQGTVRSTYASCVPPSLEDAERARKVGFADVPTGGYDPHARIVVLDQEGIEAAFHEEVSVCV